MKLLIDEKMPPAITELLRGLGHDVVAVSEFSKSAPDDVLLAAAQRAGRVVVTQDLDFGDLVFLHGAACTGVIQVRLGRLTAAEFVKKFATKWSEASEQAVGNFVVMGREKTRVTPLPRREAK